jgi:phage terminase small subunit
MLKNQRHELFLREYIANGWNGKRAYAKVYSPCKSAEIQASKLLAKPVVRKRFNQMLKKIVKRSEITEERILGKYEQAYEMAESQGKTADMISAASAQAKLVGLLRERLEAGSPGDFDRLENMSDVLAALEDRVGSEIAGKIGEALGILERPEPKPEAQPDGNLAELLPPSGSVN